MTDVDPIESLKRILAERGNSVLEQPDVVEGLLNDYSPNSKPEIYRLVSALKEEVPQRLLTARTSAHREAVIGQLREQMQINLGMDREKVSWTVNAWLKALPVQSGESPKPLEVPPEQPPATVVFVPTEELRAFIRKRARRWMFNLGWFREIEDELVERGVPRVEATKMLNEYCGKRQGAENVLAPATPFSWSGAFGSLGYFLVACACVAVFIFVFRAHPLTLLANAPAFVAEAFHRAMAGDYVGALEIVGGAALALFAFFMMIESLEQSFSMT